MHKKKVMLSAKGGQREVGGCHSNFREPCGEEHGKTEVIDAFFSSVSGGNDCVKPLSSSEPVPGSGRLKKYSQ